MPALISVAFRRPIFGTSISSTKLPVGNILPSPSAGSRNSICTSAAGKVTPSSSKSPVSKTAPVLHRHMGNNGFADIFCQILTVHRPSEGILDLSTKPCSMANAPTAAVRYRSCRSNRQKVYRWKLVRTNNRHRDRRVRICPKSRLCWWTNWRYPNRQSVCRKGLGCRVRATGFCRVPRLLPAAAAGRSVRLKKMPLDVPPR